MSDVIEELDRLEREAPSTGRARALELLREVAGAELAWFYSVVDAAGELRYGTIVHTDGCPALEAALRGLTGAPVLSAPWLDLEHPRKAELESFVDLDTRVRWHDEAAYRASALHRELYGPAGVTSDLSLLVYDGDRLVGWIGAVRTSEPAFTTRDRRRISPYVAPFSRVLVEADRAEDALVSAGAVHVLVGPNGELRHASQTAETLLAGAPFRERLAAQVSAVDRGDASSAVFHLGRMELRIDRLDATDQVAYLVSAVPAARPRLRAASALTATQRRIALHAVNGQTVAEIARAVGCGSETVRTHLREIYRRLGVSTRLELADALGERTSADLPPSGPSAPAAPAAPPLHALGRAPAHPDRGRVDADRGSSVRSG